LNRKAIQEEKMNSIGVGGQNLQDIIHRYRLQRGFAFGVLIVSALLAFEIFNFSTTDYALGDLLGDLSFAGVRWATILAIAFCGIDFAGIARLFTPEQGAGEPAEMWYLFGAWLLAATMNAMLTWWGVSIALLNHHTLGNAVVEQQTLIRIVPVFVAIMVWLIRVLIIGTFSVAGERLFSQASTSYRPPVRISNLDTNTTSRSIRGSHRPSLNSQNNTQYSQARTAITAHSSASTQASSFRSSGRPSSHRNQPRQEEEAEYIPENDYRQEGSFNRAVNYQKSEPTYHPATMNAKNEGSNTQTRRL
jgi:hypothetical protein